MLSISSLAIYAHACRYFVVVAPATVHVDSMRPCNKESYARRGWCRLEQAARMAVGGLTNMFVYDDYRLIAFDSNDGWARDAVHVFEGDFTVRMGVNGFD